MGRNPSFDDCLKDGEELKHTYDSDADARRILDVARGPRGDRPQQLDPRRGGGDRRPAAGRDRARCSSPRIAPAPAERTGANGKPRALLQDRHPVLDGPDRGDRPAEDGLPRPPQPRRDRGRGRDHRALAGRRRSTSRRSRSTTRKTFEMLSRGDSIGVFQLESEGMRDALRQVRPTEFDDIVALGRALPAGRDALHPRLRAAASATPPRSATRTRACARSPSRPTAAASTRSS